MLKTILCSAVVLAAFVSEAPAQSTSMRRPFIRSLGEGSVSVQPDLAKVDIGVVTVAATAQDASMQKTFVLTERMTLRTTVDLFNVFNTQGLNAPAGDGIVTLQNSFGGFGFKPRQVQLGMRLDW